MENLGNIVLNSSDSLATVNAKKNYLEFRAVPICRLNGAEKYKTLVLQLVSTRFSPSENYDTTKGTTVFLSGPDFTHGEIENTSIVRDRVTLCEIETHNLDTRYKVDQYQPTFSWAIENRPFIDFILEYQQEDGTSDEEYAESQVIFQVYGKELY